MLWMLIKEKEIIKTIKKKKKRGIIQDKHNKDLKRHSYWGFNLYYGKKGNAAGGNRETRVQACSSGGGVQAYSQRNLVKYRDTIQKSLNKLWHIHNEIFSTKNYPLN